MAVAMLTGARGAGPWPLLLAGSSACPGRWFPLQPGSVSRVLALKAVQQQRYLCGPSVGQDTELTPTHWEVLSANLSCSPPPLPHSTTILGSWSSMTALGCKETLVLVYRP